MRCFYWLTIRKRNCQVVKVSENRKEYDWKGNRSHVNLFDQLWYFWQLAKILEIWFQEFFKNLSPQPCCVFFYQRMSLKKWCWIISSCLVLLNPCIILIRQFKDNNSRIKYMGIGTRPCALELFLLKNYSFSLLSNCWQPSPIGRIVKMLYQQICFKDQSK